ncbi:hypothetical protein [Caballeronia sp. TF1N1]|uniref:portal protein n=1 Tax=Caballeronia sp. TF1N1 TaxID=2878153 RepID=UPI001FD4B8AD|nr:hypothetical protein [Caballeronia sp. TF1N1]
MKIDSPNQVLAAPQVPVKKLTKWAKEPTIADLRGDFDAAKPSHDAQVTRINAWLDQLHVTGSAKPKKIKGRSAVQPKLIRRQTEWRYSALTEPFLGSDKLYQVKPANADSTQAAVQNETVLNWQFRTKLNRVNFIDNLVRCTVDEGTSVVRLGWKRVTKKVKQQVPRFVHYEIETQPQMLAFQQALSLVQEDSNNLGSLPPEMQSAISHYQETGQTTYAQRDGVETVTNDMLVENRPTAEVIEIRNFYLDPSCNGDTDKALFCIYSFETNKAEMQKEPERYRNLDAVNWEGATVQTDTEHSTNTPSDFQFRDAARKKVVAYEYWGFYDVNGTGELVPIVATWIADTMVRMELNPFPDQKIPFVVIPYMPIKRSAYGEPDAELLEDNQKILGATIRGMIDLMGRSANGQQGFAKGMLDPRNRRRYENGEDYEFNPNMPIAQGLIEHKYPEIPQSALTMVQFMNQDAEALTGVKSFSGGISGQAYGDVAKGIQTALDAASKREMAILRRLAKGMSQIGDKIIAMNGAFMSEEETIRVTADEFVQVRRDELIGNFDLIVDISTAEVDNQQSQDLAFMLQTLGPKADWSFTAMILSEIARLKRMPELAKKILAFKPQPDPMQQQLLQMQIEKEKSEIDKNNAQAELYRAQAKAASAMGDKTNLDFVEQETGTKHAREMEKQAAQAEANQNLKVTDALLKPRKQANGAESKPDIQAAVGYNQFSKAQSGAPAGQPA